MKKLSTIVLTIILIILSSYAYSSPAINKTFSAIREYYISYDEANLKELYKSALKQITIDVPEAMIKIGDKKIDVEVGLAKKDFKTPSKSISDIANSLSEIVDFVDKHRSKYPDDPEVEESALNGLTLALDPHTNYLPPKVYREFKVGTQGKFGGLGIVIGVRDGYLTVIATMDNTPASRAGIKSGDRILQIEDESTINMSLTDVVNRLRGDVGTFVNIVVERPGTKNSVKYKIARAVISIESIQSDIYKIDDTPFGYIKIKTFQTDTTKDFNKALSDIQNKADIKGLIIDLRNNTGGLLNEAVELSDRFLKKGDIVSTVGSKKILTEKESAKNQEDDIDLPVIVLINEGSASASEIVAGALKFNKRAIIVGHQSFGKGTVQTIIKLAEESALKLTIAEYLAAGSYSIQQKGITPDIKLVPVTISKDELSISENETDSEDKLKNTLKASGTTEQKPFLTLLYIDSSEIKKGKDIDAEYENKPNLKDDFSVMLSAKILKNTKDASFDALKESAKEVAPEIIKMVDDKIISSFEAQGIDWKNINSPLSIPTPMSVKWKLLDKNLKEVKNGFTGEKFFVELEIKNEWAKPIPRVLAILREPEFSGQTEHEIAIGMFAPLQTVKKLIPIALPLAMSSQMLEMSLIIKSNQTTIRPSENISINVIGKNNPELALSYKLSGNLKNKQSATINTTIKNVGKFATTKEAVVVLYNECKEDLFIEKGRYQIGIIKPNESKSLAFRFHLNSKDIPKECYLKLNVFDPEYMFGSTYRIALTLAGLLPAEGIFYTQPEININSLPFSTNENNISINGEIVSKSGIIKDWMIFANKEKLTYTRNLSNSSKMDINYNLPLEKGRNVITVIARDINDLMQSKQLIIFRMDRNEDSIRK